MPEEAKRPVGRPCVKFNKRIALDILRAWAISSYSLEHVLNELREKHPLYPSLSTVTTWKIDNAEFAKSFARAKQAKADYLADKTLDEAQNTRKGQYRKVSGKQGQAQTVEVREDDNVARSRLVAEVYRWRASKLSPRDYEDRRGTDLHDSGPNEELEALQRALLDGPAPADPDEPIPSPLKDGEEEEPVIETPEPEN